MLKQLFQSYFEMASTFQSNFEFVSESNFELAIRSWAGWGHKLAGQLADWLAAWQPTRADSYCYYYYYYFRYL